MSYHHRHSLEHQHGHNHGHCPEHEHQHGHAHGHCRQTNANGKKILCIRPQSGLSGDMLLCGLASLLGLDNAQLAKYTKQLNLAVLNDHIAENDENIVSLETRFVNGIQGKHARIALPHEHSHRSHKDIQKIIDNSALKDKTKDLAKKTFDLLAHAEAFVHGKNADEVTFHEVGALDSILDICLVCALFTELAPERFVCGALPLADGSIHCMHGILPSPAPAVLALLENTAVCSFAGKGETVTPTAIALLKALEADFGDWAAMKISKSILVYGSKTFENAPNGSIFALGTGI